MEPPDDLVVVSYICKNCKTVFFSSSDVSKHKTMTGHGEYEQQKQRREELHRSVIDKVYWCRKCHAAFVFRTDAISHKQESGHNDLAFASLNGLTE